MTLAVSVVEGGEVSVPPFALKRGRRIIIRAKAESGQPIPDDLEFTVYTQNRRIGFTKEWRPDEAVWILSAFAPGQYFLRAEKDGGPRCDATVTIEDDSDAEVTLQLEH